MPSTGRSRLTVLALLAIIAVMGGLVAGSVPLYRLYCRVTGAGGTPRIGALPTSPTTPASSTTPSHSTITVRFDTSVAKGMPWRFRPQARQMQVTLGEDNLALFSATNDSAQPVTGTAVFNVTPDKVGRYVSKIQCFCFSEQVLQPGQTVDLPVTFVVDPAIAADAHTSEVGTITLSYTFFRKGGNPS